MADQVRENMLRRMLGRQGDGRIGDRCRYERAVGYGGFMIANKWTSNVVAGAHPYDFCLTIDDVEQFAAEEPPCYPKTKPKKNR